MLRNREGTTAIYNHFHDQEEDNPEIWTLRRMHGAMDRAVLDAYGWTDIRPTCQFILDYEDDDDDTPGKASKKKKPWRYRWPDDVRDEVLARLLALNAERAKQEALAAKVGSSSAVVAPSRKRRAKPAVETPLLTAETESGEQG